MKVDRKQWQGHVTALASSGLSMAAYSRKHGLTYSQLAFWRGRLARAETAVRPPSVFVKANRGPLVAKPQSKAPKAQLVLGAGTTLEFPVSTDPRWMAALAVVIGGTAI
jgi:hypothetical protein